jgi:hypothetical protein
MTGDLLFVAYFVLGAIAAFAGWLTYEPPPPPPAVGRPAVVRPAVEAPAPEGRIAAAPAPEAP